MPSSVTLFIVEGEARDMRFAAEMNRCFPLLDDEVRVVCLPAGQNIYMLYEKLAADDFESDLVEVLKESVPAAANALNGVLRDSVGQVYLFFDYDPQQDYVAGEDADAIVEEMLSAFDNENEIGKLYISYPMVEALYDYRVGQCRSHSGCFVNAADIPAYKRISGDGNPNADKRMRYPQWKAAIESFVLRCKCLLDIEDISFEAYRERVTPRALFYEESKLLREKGRVFVL